MYASVTTAKGTVDDLAEVARMTGETMVSWLRDIEGFEAMFMLASEDAATTHVISLWRDRDVADQHREARMRLRDRIAETVHVEIEETVYYDVVFSHVGPGLRSGAAE